jgi:hypothetical protein
MECSNKKSTVREKKMDFLSEGNKQPEKLP